MSSDQPQKVDQKQRMLDASDNKVADPYPLEEYKVIGRRGVRRNDGIEKATGAAQYTLDVQLPGMLFARFLTSPYPHAKILSMDTSAAEKMPGVRCILRYDDPELQEGVAVSGHELNSVAALPGVAHFQGEECGAFVVADSEEMAENALKLIKVDWEQRPFILDVEKAIEPGAPLTDSGGIPRFQPGDGLRGEARRCRKGLRRGRQDHRVQVDLRPQHLGGSRAALRGVELERRLRRGVGQAAAPPHRQAGHLHLVRRHPHEQDRHPLPLPGGQLRRLEPDGLEPGRHVPGGAWPPSAPAGRSSGPSTAARTSTAATWTRASSTSRWGSNSTAPSPPSTSAP